MIVTLTHHDGKRLRHAATEVRRANETLRQRQRMREEAIRIAARNGATVREIAEVTGISHQRVHQIVGPR